MVCFFRRHCPATLPPEELTPVGVFLDVDEGVVPLLVPFPELGVLATTNAATAGPGYE